MSAWAIEILPAEDNLSDARPTREAVEEFWLTFVTLPGK